MTCALNVAGFRESVYSVIRNIEGGFWAASINRHPYNLYSLWNVKGTDVKVIHFNFSDAVFQNLPQLHAISKEHLEILNVHPIITLEDGERAHNETALPLTQFTTTHMFTDFKAVQIWDRSGTTVVPVHLGELFTDAFRISGVEIPTD